VTDLEFASVAYAFLDALPHIGSGNPKGISIAESDNQMLLVLDRYLVPRGKRPIISPSVTDAEIAIQDFIQLETPQTNSDRIQTTYFERWIGDAALENCKIIPAALTTFYRHDLCTALNLRFSPLRL